MTLPLEGIRVLDWTIWQQGPICSMMLADMGADVIKIERPGVGDPGRSLFAAGGVVVHRPNWYFEANNRNKRSITIDVSQPAGRDVLYALAERSDVFVQNFRQGVADRLGLGYATMQEKNPRLIYASATGYGPYGPDSARPAYDQLGLARSGMMLAAGEPGMPPLDIAGGISDQLTGAMLAYGVTTALFARERTGRGQEVNASQLGSMLFLQSLSVSMKLMTGTAIPRTARASAMNPLWNRYRCADDKWLAVAMLEADRYWADLTRAIGRPELAGDERFAEIHERAAHAVECVAILDDVFATRPRDAWIRILEDDPGDFIYTVVNSVDDLPDDPQVRANDYIVTIDHPQCGRTDMVGVPVQLSDTPGSVRAPAPELGQHTEEVLTEVLHWDWDQLNALRATGVI